MATRLEGQSRQELLLELDELTRRLQEAEDTLDAIRSGGVDALVVATPQGQHQLFTLEGADRVYRVFLEAISQGALTLSWDGMVVYANAAAAEILPAGGGGPVGTQLRASVRKDERPRFDALLEGARRGPVDAEIRLRGKTGGRPFYVSLRPLEDRSDRMIVALLTDLTERKKTEKVLEAERLARSILEQTGESIVVCDQSGLVIRASRAVTRLAGQNPLFQPFEAVLPLRTADGGRPFSLKGRSRPKPVRGLEVLFDRRDGTSFSLIVNADPLQAAGQGPIGTVLTLTDVTRLKQAEQAQAELLRRVELANTELAAIESVSLAGLRLVNVDQLVHSIVSQVAIAMGADQATLLLARDGRLDLSARVPPLEAGQQFSIRIGEGFAGTIAKMRRGLFIEDVKSSRLVKRAELKRQVVSLLGAPLLHEDAVLGVLHVGWKERRSAEVHQQRFLEIIAHRAATAIAARALTEQLHDQQMAAEQLAQKLGATNGELVRINEAEREARRRARQELDRTRLLQAMTSAVTNSLSLSEIGHSVVSQMSRSMNATTASIYSVDATAGKLSALALVGYPDDAAAEIPQLPLDEESVVGHLVLDDLPLLTHKSGYLPSPAAERLRRIGADVQRWIALAIRNGGRTLGVIALTFEGSRPFEEDELSLYRSIAELLGGAFENVRLYEEQQRIAATLQENFLHPLPTVQGLELGIVSGTAFAPELVGGDFSDVFLLADGRVAILIGDVAGKGVRAAGLTETVRSTVRAFAAIDESPAFVLRKTSEALLRYDSDEAHVTAFLAVLDSRTGHLSFASAGHPAPIHLGPYSCAPLQVTFGPPLGTFARDYTASHATLTLEDYLVLYTDGVTEARSDGDLFGEERLVEAVAGLRGCSAQELADGVHDAALAFAGRLRDDLQVVTLRLG